MSRIAITMPAWNQRPELLTAAVLSAYHSEARVYLVDDGSDTPIVNTFGDWVTLIRIEHGGVPAAFNAALERIEEDGDAEFICRMGSDDALDPDKIQRQVAFMEALGADASFHDCRDSRTGQPYPTGLDKGGPDAGRTLWRKRLRSANRFYGGTSMIRADVLRGYRHPAELVYSHDWNLHCWVEANSDGWEYLPRVLSTIGRYDHGLEQTSRRDSTRADACVRLVQEAWSGL